MPKAKHPPMPRYGWIRAMGAVGTPGVAEHIAPDFWVRIEVIRIHLLPSQRAVFDRYRSGAGVAVIASELGWQKGSVYKRLAEVDTSFRRALS